MMRDQEIKKANSEFDKQNQNNALAQKGTNLSRSGSIFGSDIMKSGFNPFGGGNEEVNNLKKKLDELKLPEEAKKIVD